MKDDSSFDDRPGTPLELPIELERRRSPRTDAICDPRRGKLRRVEEARQRTLAQWSLSTPEPAAPPSFGALEPQPPPLPKARTAMLNAAIRLDGPFVRTRVAEPIEEDMVGDSARAMTLRLDAVQTPPRRAAAMDLRALAFAADLGFVLLAVALAASIPALLIGLPPRGPLIWLCVLFAIAHLTLLPLIDRRTPGMALLGLRLDGDITPSRMAARVAILFAEAATLGLLMLATRDGITLHDVASETRVVAD